MEGKSSPRVKQAFSARLFSTMTVYQTPVAVPAVRVPFKRRDPSSGASSPTRAGLRSVSRFPAHSQPQVGSYGVGHVFDECIGDSYRRLFSGDLFSANAHLVTSVAAAKSRPDDKRPTAPTTAFA